MGGCTSKDGVQETMKKKGKGPAPISAFKNAEDLHDFEKFFPAGTASSLSKNLTKEIWDEYKDESCDSGVSFKTCIFSGVKNLDSGIGVYAGSH